MWQGPPAAVGGWRTGDGLLTRDLFSWGFSKIGAGTGKENKVLWHMCDKFGTMMWSVPQDTAGRFRKMESRDNLFGLFAFCDFHVSNKWRPVCQKT